MPRPLQRRWARTLAGIAASAGLIPALPPAAGAQEPDKAASAGEMKPYVEAIPGSTVTFQMVPIPGGTYQMGSPESEPKRSKDEGPQHPVTVKPFWMGRTEVTWDEYDQYAFSARLSKLPPPENAAPEDAGARKRSDAVTAPTKPYADMTFGYGHKAQPAICMTHHAALEYCRWLSAKTGKPYRLPTEAEWEFACRAGTTTAYSFGDDPAPLDEYAWSVSTAEKPQPVGKKKANPWGLFDMHGNVAEWCVDHYAADAYGKFPTDKPTLGPVVLPTAKEYPYVARGGSWDDDADRLRSAARKSSDKEWSMQDPQRPQSIWWHTDAHWVGIRVVRTLDEKDELKDFRSPIVRGKGSR